MPGPAKIQIVGLKQLQADLRALDGKLPAELRKVNLSVSKMIAAKAQARATGLGGVHAKAAASIKATAEQRSASITIKASAAIPMALGAEFGAGHNTPRQRATGTYEGLNALPTWRGNSSDAGYALYPTIQESDTAIVQAYSDALGALLDYVFHD